MTARELWKRNRDLADAFLSHSFVQGIASGELSRERFQVYVAHDAYFLEAFARAYALALAKCRDRETMVLFNGLAAMSEAVRKDLALARFASSANTPGAAG